MEDQGEHWPMQKAQWADAEEIAKTVMQSFGIVDLDTFGTLTMKKLRLMLAQAAREGSRGIREH